MIRCTGTLQTTQESYAFPHVRAYVQESGVKITNSVAHTLQLLFNGNRAERVRIRWRVRVERTPCPIQNQGERPLFSRKESHTTPPGGNNLFFVEKISVIED